MTFMGQLEEAFTYNSWEEFFKEKSPGMWGYFYVITDDLPL